MTHHPVNWDLSQILTFKGQNTLLKAAEDLADDIVLRRIAGIDLIAFETKYHKGCYNNYTSTRNRKLKCSYPIDSENESIYEECFSELINEVE